MEANYEIPETKTVMEIKDTKLCRESNAPWHDHNSGIHRTRLISYRQIEQ